MRGSIFKRGGKWAACAELPRDAKGARRRRWSSGHTTRKAAEAAPVSMQHEIANGIDIAPARLGIDSYLRRWLRHVTPRVAPRTAALYRGVVENRLIPTFGGIEIARVNPLLVSEAVASWSTGPRGDGREGVLSKRSVQLALVVLRMALDQAVRWNLTARNPASAVDAPRVIRKEQAFVSIGDLTRLFEASAEDGILAPVVTAVGLGLRRGELLGLKWSDLDLDRGTISVSRTLQRIDGKLVTKEPKTSQSRRTLVAPAFVLDALRDHRRAQSEARLALGIGRAKDIDAWMFANAEGGPLDLDAFGKKFMRTTKRAGLAHVHLHSLRHGYAVLGLQAGIDIKVISSNLGHSSIRLTADTYSHVVSSVGQDAADRLDGARSEGPTQPGVTHVFEPAGCRMAASGS
jgi:integrase